MPGIDLVSTARKEIAHYQRTQHCGRCGQPGTWCQCKPADPCACRDLHEMGSEVGVPAAAAFGVRRAHPEQEPPATLF